jgi:hypothetical protein
MHGPDGANHANESVFAEIERGGRVVVDHVSPPLPAGRGAQPRGRGHAGLMDADVRRPCSRSRGATHRRAGERTEPDAAGRRSRIDLRLAPMPGKGSAKAARMGKGARCEELSPHRREELLVALNARFEENMNRHKSLAWANVRSRLDAHPGKLWSLNEMERTAGEPDVVGHDKRRASTSSMTAPRRALPAVEAFVMTGKRSTPGKSTSRPIVPPRPQARWESSS